MVEQKPWFSSKSIWGSLISLAASLSATFGVDIDAPSQEALAEAMVQFIGAAGALVAIYGRLTATRVIV